MSGRPCCSPGPKSAGVEELDGVKALGKTPESSRISMERNESDFCMQLSEKQRLHCSWDRHLWGARSYTSHRLPPFPPSTAPSI